MEWIKIYILHRKMRIFAITITLAILLNVAFAINMGAPVLNDKFIQNHNSKNAPWVAKRNARFEGHTIGQVMAMMGTKKVINNNAAPSIKIVDASIPSTFDAREQWPGCVHAVLNQEQCGSCWAFSSSEALSDRLCIASKGQVNVTLSPQALVACDDIGNQGCNGGVPQLAWEYMEWKGLPTFECYPYTAGNGTDGTCQRQCADGSAMTYYRAKPFSMTTCNSVACIQNEIITYGPVVGTMMVYQDFMSYSSGVYVYDGTAELLGGHAIEIVGWGTDATSKLDYWIVKNSWSAAWGGLDGYFWIQRGTNMCGIDHDASASQAKL
ncbi:hypothetical protein DFA_08585 [Cavenderia fasciculata]|uniref:Peptidase C1A papain C-terminal domain-containing protein n=1 Tax=Cavenderia fasciculata TaxID=261658 RepID=F4Q379_CACFS|nr:uncharacterized protein DFA_08585 [Cavenderia fasciculata]EGG17589.1 hypothetical protein DFA_08585 [Cavenderia fasciculata]|eukprot:XP_004356073.1 hypothetical protein DFA_08585 [Cavenderia fasciculata]